MTSETIAITGATGSLGRQFLVEQARRDPSICVIALARDPAAALLDPLLRSLANRLRDRMIWIQSDLLDLNLSIAERKLLETADSLWHFAACTSLNTNGDANDNANRVNVGGTTRLIAQLEHMSRPPALHYISTAYVAGCRGGVVLESELDSGQSFRNGYEVAKMEAEKLARSWFAAGGAGLIYRPSLILETNADGGLNKITSVFARLVARAIEEGENLLSLRLPSEASINMVPENWTVRTMCDLVEFAPPVGTCFHLAAAQPTRLCDIANAVAKTVPTFRIHFRSTATADSLTRFSRMLDAALEGLRPYLDANIHFDRSNTISILGGRFIEPTIDLEAQVLRFMNTARTV